MKRDGILSVFPVSPIILFFLCGCAFTPGPQSPELAPIAASMALYQSVQSVALTVEFLSSASCSRFTPFDRYRFVLTHKDEWPKKNPIVDRYVANKTMTINDTKLVKGQYEAKVYHEDQPEKSFKKIISITNSSPVVLMDLPCLD